MITHTRVQHQQKHITECTSAAQINQRSVVVAFSFDKRRGCAGAETVVASQIRLMRVLLLFSGGQQ